MSNTSLTTEGMEGRRPQYVSGGFYVATIFLIIIFAVYFGMTYLNDSTKKKLVSAEEEYIALNESLLSSDQGEKVLDFKNRMDISKKVLGEDIITGEIMSNIENYVLSSAYLDFMRYDKDEKIVSLGFIGVDFDSVARQILSFSENDYFSGVSLEKSEYNTEEKRLEFVINLKIK